MAPVSDTGNRARRALAGTGIDAGALERGDVSYRELRAAGVPASVATRLRRTHSLVWAFRWYPDTDLRERARRVHGLREGEREWVTKSDSNTCERCGGRLRTYELGTSATTACEDCGHAGVSVDHGAERAETESWERALDRVKD